MDLEALTFDFWNTLAIDSQPVRVRELAAERMITQLKAMDIHITAQDMFKVFAECRKICYSYQEDKEIDFTPKEQLDWILGYFDIDVKPDMWNKLFLDYTTSLFDFPPTFERNLAVTLKELGRRYKMAVICNTGRTPGWVVRKIMKDNGLERYFEALIFSNEMGVSKPNPIIFEVAAKLLSAHPSRIMHVGDDPHTDVGGALKAGFKAGWYNRIGMKGDLKCHFILESVSDLLKINP